MNGFNFCISQSWSLYFIFVLRKLVKQIMILKEPNQGENNFLAEFSEASNNILALYPLMFDIKVSARSYITYICLGMAFLTSLLVVLLGATKRMNSFLLLLSWEFLEAVSSILYIPLLGIIRSFLIILTLIYHFQHPE